ncbi:uncharacterized protein EI97DRAFT_216963 [Westerdykella ornata]|uniref:Uncharacterized protein n=1 Tax=Westerdykella ornata TaxID=318751 RepID=A0A6A6JR02_WESOR|nr:uncharacterized protein EI97DRAFT_216963 [Westerdykella ornata]KAF2278695.1 hypothetical protein EI97DRAFT_216963 [Westerdykella ornata]
MGSGPFASQPFGQLKALFTTSRSSSAAAPKQVSKKKSNSTLAGTKSSIGGKLARMLHRRRDSGYGSSGSGKRNELPIHMPLDPKTAEEAAREFVRWQGGGQSREAGVAVHHDLPPTNDVDSDRSSVASLPEYVGSEASSSAYTQVVVYNPPLLPYPIPEADTDVAGVEARPQSVLSSASSSEYDQIVVHQGCLVVPFVPPELYATNTPTQPASVHSSASSSEYTQTVVYHGLQGGTTLEAAALQYVTGRVANTQQPLATANDLNDCDTSSELVEETPETAGRSLNAVTESGPVGSSDCTHEEPSVYGAIDSHAPAESTQSQCALVTSPLKRTHRQVKRPLEALHPEENTIRRRQHRFFEALTRRAAEGHGYAMANALDVVRHLENNPDPNSFLRLPSMGLYRHELSKNDWLWLRRAQMIWSVQKQMRRGLLAAECGEIIITQLVPEGEHQILPKQYFEVYLDFYVKEGIWCSQTLAQRILMLQVTPEELRLGPCVVLPEPVKSVAPQFQKLPIDLRSTTPVALSRFKQLLHLCEAVAYERKEWKGLAYDNGLKELQLYCAAFHATKGGQNPPADLMPHYRNWTYPEQRLLRAGELIARLLQEVNEGRFDLAIFQVIRGTLLNVRAQPYLDLEEFEKFFYSCGVEAGVQISEIPRILILHPEYDFQSQRDEERVFSGLLANSWRFQEEEAERLRELEMAKKAYAKAIGANRFAARFKRRLKKLFKTYREPIRFHCRGCMQGRRCIA